MASYLLTGSIVEEICPGRRCIDGASTRCHGGCWRDWGTESPHLIGPSRLATNRSCSLVSTAQAQ
jgi:hypothetical protein